MPRHKAFFILELTLVSKMTNVIFRISAEKKFPRLTYIKGPAHFGINFEDRILSLLENSDGRYLFELFARETNLEKKHTVKLSEVRTLRGCWKHLI